MDIAPSDPQNILLNPENDVSPLFPGVLQGISVGFQLFVKADVV